MKEKMLRYYHLLDHADTVRAWYDGYLFGRTRIYCPWDVVNYVAILRKDKEARPRNFWMNSSGNGLLLKFLEKSKLERPQELEGLISGEAVHKPITEELTYRDLEEDEDNIWSILFMTGYLTVRDVPTDDTYALILPNREIRSVFIRQIQTLFEKNLHTDQERLERLGQAILQKDAAIMEKILNTYLKDSISIRDNAVRKNLKESFYHGYLLGILANIRGVSVKSNREAGEGYVDILMIYGQQETGVIIEVKYVENGDMEKACREALSQIKKRQYAAYFDQMEIDTVLQYGIACYRKKCRVMNVRD